MAISSASDAATGAFVVIAANQPMGDGALLTFNRLTAFLHLYRQYRVNSVKINVTVDKECGLDTALIMLQDKGDGTPCISVGLAMGQAHKAKVLTTADRTMSYGWTAKTTDEKEYHTLSDTISDNRAQYLKILQEAEPKAGGKCKHRVEVICSVTLRDSKAAAGN